MGIRLSEIVETSARVAEASGRLVKIGHLAEALRRAGAQEARVAVGVLTGVPRQGRIGSVSRVRPARVEPVRTPLTIEHGRANPQARPAGALTSASPRWRRR